MYELSTWTWRRANGTEYDASKVPVLWRRAIDLPWAMARSRFGWLTDIDPSIGGDDKLPPATAEAGTNAEDDWSGLYPELVRLARLQRTTPVVLPKDEDWSGLRHELPTLAGLFHTPPEARAHALAWRLLHRHLEAVARLWRTAPGRDPAIHYLDTYALPRDAAAEELRAAFNILVVNGELMPRLDGWRVRLVPKTLRGFLLLSCAASIAEQHRFRRCEACNEWFAIPRTDARFCSNACRQAGYQAAGKPQPPAAGP